MMKKDFFSTWRGILLFFVMSMLYPMSAFAGLSDATFKLTVKAHSENTGKGFVYISTKEGAPVTNNYGQDKTAESSATGADPRAFYVYAKPVRGYEFDSWTMSEGYATDCYSNLEGNKMTFNIGHTQTIADKGDDYFKNTSRPGNNQSFDGWKCAISLGGIFTKYVNKVEFSRSDATITANWKTATKFVGTFIPSAHGEYSVNYSYAQLNNAKTGLTDKTDSYTIAKGDPLNSEGWKLVDTYNPDVITLIAGAADNGYGFDGWGSSDAAGTHSDKNTTYVLPHTGAMTVSALYSPVSFGDVTSNSGVVAQGAPVSGTVVVATKLADAKADFRAPVFNNSAFSVTSWSYSNNALTINYTYTQPAGMTEDETAQLTVTSLGGENKKNINVTARLARVTGVSSYDEFLLAIKGVDNSKSGVAYFTVENATGNTPFNAPNFGAIKDEQGNTVSDVAFTVDSWSYADNKVQVNYTYTHNNIVGVHSSDLTLTTKTGTSYTVTILGDIEEKRVDEAQASILTPDGDGNLVERTAGTWADMFTAVQNTYATAEVVPTIRIYEDIELAAVATITKSINVDLYGKTISGAVNNLVTINGSGITVTITDSRVGGKIDVTTDVNASLNAVYVKSGNLVVDNAIISATNTNATATAYRAAAVKVDAGATFTLERGKILSTAPVYAYAVYSSGTTTVNGGLIHAEAEADNVAGVYQNGGSVTTNGGVIEAVSKQLTASAANCEGAWGIWTNTSVTATVNGGAISGVATSEEFGKYAYAIFSKGTTTINGGTLTGIAGKQYAYGVRVDAGTTTVNGGTISASAPQGVRGLLATNAAKMYVEGGIVTAIATATDACGMWLGETAEAEVSDGVIKAIASTSKAYSMFCNKNTVKLNVIGGKFNADAPADVAPINTTATASNCVISDGYYDKKANLATYADASQQMFVYAIPGNKLEYEQGYRYSVGNANTGAVVCKVISDAGTTWFNTLEKALSYVNNNPGRNYTIIMTEDYTMAPGNYTLPSYATLVVPYKEDQVAAVGNTVARVVTDGQSYVTPKLFRKLTMPNGVNMDVYGTIEASSTQSIQNGNTQGYVGKYYGHIVMAKGSHMTLQSGSRLLAWGYVTGEANPTTDDWKQGSIDARRGAVIRELFQIQDWMGGKVVSGMLGNSREVFPVNQYAIQNVEVPVTYHPGARLICAAGVFIPTGSITAASDQVNVVGVSGDVALFLMNEEADAENTWVKKSYDPKKDRLNFAINSSAKLGSLDINISGYEMDSRDYILPITNNISIELQTGDMEITQSTMFLPGSELTVDKEATVVVNEILELGMTQKQVSIYACASKECGDPAKDGKFFLKSNYTSPVSYSPSWASNPRSASTACPDAKIEVRGTLDIKGHAYTSESGANIFSTNDDAGTVIFSSGTAAVNGTIAYVNSNENGTISNTIGYGTRPAPSAMLKNANGTFTSTTGAKDADAYCYKNGAWSCWKQMGCMAVDKTDPENPIFYAKPGDYVAVDAEQIDLGDDYYEYEGNDDHTFSAVDGSDRIFILDYDHCQWWEVEKVEELYYCETNGKYYVYNEDLENWEVKTVNVKWQNWDGTIIEDYEVNYNATPEYLGSFPKRSKDAYFTYTFTGWLPEVGPVKNDVVYIAQFEKEDVMYSIVFKDENDKTIFEQYLKAGETPACKNEPQKPGYYLYWEPTISAVTGDQVYQATYQAEARTEFNVVFKNFDGTILQESIMQVGETPIYTEELPVKESVSADAAFEFDGWNPEIAEVSEDVIYTAKFKEVTPKYTITFKNGDDVLQSSKWAYGETPIYSGITPTKTHANPTGYYYELVWSPLVSAVVGNQTYTTTFQERPNTMRLIVEGGLHGTVNVAVTDQDAQNGITRYSEILDYGTEATIEANCTSEHYHFARWSDGVTTNPRTVTVTGYATYTAIYELDRYDITFVKGNGEPNEVVSFAWGETPAIADPVRPGYTFKGWGTIVPVAGPATYTAQWEQVLANLPVETSKTVGNATYNEVTVTTTGVLTVGSANTLTANALIIEANTSASGEIINAQNIAAANAYFDFNFEATAYSKATANWYAFAVPFEVDAATGIFYNGQHLDYVRDINIVRYNGATRAALGTDKTVMEYIDELPDHTLYPGVLYMAAFVRNYNEHPVRFVKKSGASLVYSTPVQVELHSSVKDADANWNAIANPTLYKAYLGTGVAKGQFYVNGENRYVVAEFATDKFPVGKPVFIQAKDECLLVVNRTAPASAPMRVRTQNQTVQFDLRIADENGKMTDRLFARASEEADATAYTIGEDLAKAGVSNRVAQMWLSAYGLQLCQQTALLDNDCATWTLGISAPKAGEYSIYLENAPENADLYLTYGGQAIWNLSDGAYMANLTAGNNTGYGLRLGIAQAPGTATNLDEALVNASGKAEKVVVNGKLYILTGERVFDANGKLVK